MITNRTSCDYAEALGATLPHQRQAEARDRTHAEALTLW